MSRLPSRAAQVTLWVLVWSGPPVPPGQPVRLGRHHLHGLSKRNVGQPAPPRTTRVGEAATATPSAWRPVRCRRRPGLPPAVRRPSRRARLGGVPAGPGPQAATAL
jgi:hypothetical protein